MLRKWNSKWFHAFSWIMQLIGKRTNQDLIKPKCSTINCDRVRFIPSGNSKAPEVLRYLTEINLNIYLHLVTFFSLQVVWRQVFIEIFWFELRFECLSIDCYRHSQLFWICSIFLVRVFFRLLRFVSLFCNIIFWPKAFCYWNSRVFIFNVTKRIPNIM